MENVRTDGTCSDHIKLTVWNSRRISASSRSMYLSQIITTCYDLPYWQTYSLGHSGQIASAFHRVDGSNVSVKIWSSNEVSVCFDSDHYVSTHAS